MLNIDLKSGHWSIEVYHFTKYGNIMLVESDDDEDLIEEEQSSRILTKKNSKTKVTKTI